MVSSYRSEALVSRGVSASAVEAPTTIALHAERGIVLQPQPAPASPPLLTTPAMAPHVGKALLRRQPGNVAVATVHQSSRPILAERAARWWVRDLPCQRRRV